MSQELAGPLDGFSGTLWEWADNLLTTRPETIAKVWVAGLKAAGLSNVRQPDFRRLHLKVPMAVEFTCPFWHPGKIAGTFATTRLLVDAETGWVSHYPGVARDQGGIERGTGTCQQCRYGTEFWEFLLLCPSCLDGSHQEHPRFFDFYGMEHDRFLVDPEDSTSEPIDRAPLALVLHALDLYFQQGQIAPSKPSWTDESAATWLTENGIEPGMSHRAVWAAVKDTEGRPPEKVVRGGLRLLKGPTS